MMSMGEQGTMQTGRETPARLLQEAIDLLRELIQDGRQRLDEATSTTEWVKLAGALGQAETRLAQLLAAQAKLGGEVSDFEAAFLQAIQAWHDRKSPVVASGKTAEQLEAQNQAGKQVPSHGEPGG
jgi:hypothetical protein